ncbi:RelA/SpoT domain-containing protein [Acinetobacter sp. ASP199]|uniref:GTP pyrophosphokinase n=1 Tax=unclassified Acinetobacter TaxID=196816 RepID=UPI0023DEC35E|nr:RelA/SpoT domain-containing protein [Acinetobacter sp. ASP199]UNT59954.1 RelA/SpoT domain-containing protein [Acinetobacter sp. ASP199]
MNSKVEIKTKEDHGLWYDNNIDPYKGLAEIIAVTLKNSLISQQISFVDVPYRSKTKKSFLKKIQDKLTEKDYSPESMTDLAGIRVITLIEADVQKVCDLITAMFNVHKADSVNKSEKLGEEKVGYRSVHFVCDVGKNREKLPEFSAYKGLCFEIQVRTALEHAWAEIEHDRGYKLGGKLPSYLNRRFKLLSGLLESADLEFNRLTVEIEEYAKQVNENINKDILNYELTNIGLKKLFQNKYKSLKFQDYELEASIGNILISELNLFGLDTLSKLDKEIEKLTNQYDFQPNNTILGFCRDLMMLENLSEYFEKVFFDLRPWGATDIKTYNFLTQKYTGEEIDNIFDKYDVYVIEDD